MRKVLIFLASFLSLTFFSCDHADRATVASSSETSAAQKNLDAHHTISKAFETGDLSGIGKLQAASCKL